MEEGSNKYKNSGINSGKRLKGPKFSNNLKQWEKGQSGNPSGRPPLPSEVHEFRRLTIEETVECANKYLRLTFGKLRSINKNKLPTLEAIFVSILSKAATKGDPIRLNAILDRLIGKPIETKHFLEIKRDELLERRKELQNMTRPELIKRMEKTLEELKSEL